MRTIEEQLEALTGEVEELELRLRLNLIARLRRVLRLRAEERGRRPGVKGEAAQELGVSNGFLSMVLHGQRNMPIQMRQWLEAEEACFGLVESSRGTE